MLGSLVEQETAMREEENKNYVAAVDEMTKAITALEKAGRRPYLVRRRVLLRLTSEATFPRDLNSLEGICPCPGSRAWAYGAHLATQVERI